MPVTLPPVPNPPPADVQRIDPRTGKPTQAWRNYEDKLTELLKQIKAWIEAQP